ncbi:Uncharacterised protein [Raoultella ornithinolytica]|nr:Uncharacterised protein [Raoultella ornithinolytica]
MLPQYFMAQYILSTILRKYQNHAWLVFMEGMLVYQSFTICH